jgi:hypothetical protein
MYTAVMKSAEATDNPLTKLRSLMLRTVCKRDIGQCEVSRLLFSEPLYHSTFDYVSQSLDLSSRQLNFDQNSSLLVKINLLDYYADRDSNEFLKPHLASITSFIEFVKKFVISCGVLKLKDKPHLIVVTTSPRVRYNPSDLKCYTNYCFYQMIKYSNWKREDMISLSNVNDCIRRWESFLLIAPFEVLNVLKYKN